MQHLPPIRFLQVLRPDAVQGKARPLSKGRPGTRPRCRTSAVLHLGRVPGRLYQQRGIGSASLPTILPYAFSIKMLSGVTGKEERRKRRTPDNSQPLGIRTRIFFLLKMPMLITSANANIANHSRHKQRTAHKKNNLSINKRERFKSC